MLMCGLYETIHRYIYRQLNCPQRLWTLSFSSLQAQFNPRSDSKFPPHVSLFIKYVRAPDKSVCCRHKEEDDDGGEDKDSDGNVGESDDIWGRKRGKWW
ncbi:hypothetical protein RRG08_008545 [Elysia crispata]|uniref:Uncharacterized protein n=1 Tax=Elysia crispata TaxID=231223 RepID=A0AAE1CWS2_9GAST|nr:hypothetical protein RRG08_008545 [Elysia crispata]